MWSCGRQNSKDFLKDGSCHPVVGLSVWAAAEPLDARGERDVLAITAPFDSSAFFKDLAYGASAEISSLAVLMAVVEAVGNYRRVHQANFLRLPVFFASNGEAWGFSGSGRFLKELRDSKCSKPGPPSVCMDREMPSLNLQGAKFSVLSIDSVSSVTTPPSENPQFYIRSSRGEDSSTLRGKLTSHLRNLLGNLESEGNEENVVPPTAAQSFERDNKGDLTEVISIADYQKEFRNSFYRSQFDNASLTIR